MSFIQRFLERVLRTNTSRMPRTSFDDLSQDQLDAHLRVGRYGDFALTDAVRPSFGLEVIPREGYRRDVYCDPETGNKMPVLAASVSAERLFDVLMDLLDPLGDEVDVVMESSHESEPGAHADLYREHIDTVILKSTLYDYEQLLLHDGCTGLAALNPNGPMEVQFDEHKLLFVYANDLEPFEPILIEHGLKRDDTPEVHLRGRAPALDRRRLPRAVRGAALPPGHRPLRVSTPPPNEHPAGRGVGNSTPRPADLFEMPSTRWAGRGSSPRLTDRAGVAYHRV